jgi:dTDP-4-amino-4,6-dideoxygalactose transaminase
MLGFKRGDFPEAECYYSEAITLPLYYNLSDEDQDFVIENLRKAV